MLLSLLGLALWPPSLSLLRWSFSSSSQFCELDLTPVASQNMNLRKEMSVCFVTVLQSLETSTLDIVCAKSTLCRQIWSSIRQKGAKFQQDLSLQRLTSLFSDAQRMDHGPQEILGSSFWSCLWEAFSSAALPQIGCHPQSGTQRCGPLSEPSIPPRGCPKDWQTQLWQRTQVVASSQNFVAAGLQRSLFSWVSLRWSALSSHDTWQAKINVQTVGHCS